MNDTDHFKVYLTDEQRRWCRGIAKETYQRVKSTEFPLSKIDAIEVGITLAFRKGAYASRSAGLWTLLMLAFVSGFLSYLVGVYVGSVAR